MLSTISRSATGNSYRGRPRPSRSCSMGYLRIVAVALLCGFGFDGLSAPALVKAAEATPPTTSPPSPPKALCNCACGQKTGQCGPACSSCDCEGCAAPLPPPPPMPPKPKCNCARLALESHIPRKYSSSSSPLTRRPQNPFDMWIQAPAVARARSASRASPATARAARPRAIRPAGPPTSAASHAPRVKTASDEPPFRVASLRLEAPDRIAHPQCARVRFGLKMGCHLGSPRTTVAPGDRTR